MSFKRPPTAKAFVSLVRGEPNELRKKMLVLGYVSDKLEKKRQYVVLVGGQAVETYTGGQFPTGDIDIATTDPKMTEKVLKTIGFTREGMIWYSKQLNVAFHIVGQFSPKLEKERTIKVGPYKTRIIGVEDLILDRLKAAKFWNIPSDLEKAKVLYANFKSQIDLDYLKGKAKKDKVDDILAAAGVTRLSDGHKPGRARCGVSRSRA